MGDRKFTGTLLSELFHHRWAVPVLAVLESLQGGAKFVTLERALGTNRDSLGRTLKALGVMGLVARNPGYGHPMRPEYLLTPAGKRLAPACRLLMEKLDRLRIADLALNKWSLPLIHALDATEGRFNALKDAVAGITPRALTAALRDVEAAGLIARRLVDERPPRSNYDLTRRGREVFSLLSEMARIVALLPGPRGRSSG